MRRTRQEVIQWLKDHGLYEKMVGRLPYPIERYPMEDNDLPDFFIMAFKWEYAPEGEAYWQNINRKYTDWFNGIDG